MFTYLPHLTTGVVLAGALCAEASPSHAGSVPFAWDAPSMIFLSPGGSVTITVSAAAVTGIGAVSGFAQIRLEPLLQPSGLVLRADVLPPFDALAQHDGESGEAITGLDGGQIVLPPLIPIDYSLMLFEVTITDMLRDQRTTTLQLTGLGGVFLDPLGTSTVPFAPLAPLLIDVVVMPAPGGVAVLALAAVAGARRRRA